METLLIRKQLHQYIDNAADAQIEAIYVILEEKVEALKGRISIEQYNEEIEASEQEYESGKYTTHADFKNEIKKWPR